MRNFDCQIYALIDPRDGKYRYVGKAQDVHARYRHHISTAGKGSTHKARWIKQLLDLRLKPELLVLSTMLAGDDWQKEEKFWIDHLREFGCPLTNTASGGIGGLHGYKHTDETRTRMSAAQKGRTFSAETRSKMRAAKLGKKIGQEHRAKISESLRMAYRQGRRSKVQDVEITEVK